MTNDVQDHFSFSFIKILYLRPYVLEVARYFQHGMISHKHFAAFES